MTAQAQKQSQIRESSQKRQAAPPVRRAEHSAEPAIDRLELQRAALDPASAGAGGIFALQHTAGNRAVSRLIQAKLTVGGAHDAYEQEADRVAESVLSAPVRAGAAGAQSGSVQRQGEEEEVQTKPLAASISRLVQRQGPEEEKIQTKPVLQRQAEEEEEIQTKPVLQRQAEEEEEIQTKPVLQRQAEEEEEIQTKPVLQRQAEEEEEIQTKPVLQRQAEEEEEIQTKPVLQRQAQEEEEVQTKRLQRLAPEEEEVQAKAQGGDGAFEAGAGVERRLATSRGGGAPLPSEVRSYMEPRFGADFSGVRVHADGEAAGLNRTLQARAFTHGQDIYMGAGAYTPGSTDGKRLLAHELTHVVQQSGRTDRVARWGKGMGGGTPHPVVTKMAFESLDQNVRKYYSQDAQNYLAEHADDIDKRLGYLIPVGFKILGQKITQARGKGMYRGGLTLKGFSKMVKKSKTGPELMDTYGSDAAERARQYDSIDGYVRNPAEAPNHAEGGMYKDFSGEGAGKLRIDEYVNKAVQQYNSGNPRDSMYTLSLALHTTQDKGAHGEGAPGTGHDPRKFFMPPNTLAKTGWVYWQKGKGKYPDLEFSSCDNVDQNPRGLQIAIGASHNTLRQYVEGIGVSIGDQGEQTEEELRKAGKLISWTKPGWFSRTMRETGRWLGGKGVIKNMRGMERFG